MKIKTYRISGLVAILLAIIMLASCSTKKNKWNSLPSTCRTSIIGMLIFIIIGICLIVYGAFFGNVDGTEKGAGQGASQGSVADPAGPYPADGRLRLQICVREGTGVAL